MPSTKSNNDNEPIEQRCIIIDAPLHSSNTTANYSSNLLSKRETSHNVIKFKTKATKASPNPCFIQSWLHTPSHQRSSSDCFRPKSVQETKGRVMHNDASSNFERDSNKSQKLTLSLSTIPNHQDQILTPRCRSSSKKRPKNNTIWEDGEFDDDGEDDDNDPDDEYEFHHGDDDDEDSFENSKWPRHESNTNNNQAILISPLPKLRRLKKVCLTRRRDTDRSQSRRDSLGDQSAHHQDFEDEKYVDDEDDESEYSGEFENQESGEDLVEAEESREDSEFESVLRQCLKYSERLKALLKRCTFDNHNGLTPHENGLSTIHINHANRPSTTPYMMEPQPKSLGNSLKDYQVYGMNWMYLLHNEGLSCILADEMGLGKTIQTISLITLLKEKGYQGSHIIIVPASTINNWRREFSIWSKDLTVLLYHGTQTERANFRQNIISHSAEYRQGKVKNQYPFDILMTTFQTASNKMDHVFLKRLNIYYLIVDEAQMLKGKDTNRYNYLFHFNTQYRLLLTGTPLQNNLSELSALLRFLMPKLFSALQSTRLSYEVKQLMQDKRKVTESQYVLKMKSILKPFMLRRLKREVGLGLHPKQHKLVRVKMPAIQRRVYNNIYSSSQAAINQKSLLRSFETEPAVIDALPSTSSNIHLDQIGATDHDGVFNTKQDDSSVPACSSTSNLGFMNNLLMQLRKICNHPIFVRTYYTDEMMDKIAHYVQKNDPSLQKLTITDIVYDFSFFSDFDLHKRAGTTPQLASYVLGAKQLFESSGKLLALAKLLPMLKQQGHRVIIFSQFTTALDVLELFLHQKMQYNYLRLDGSTPISERQGLIDLYNTEKEEYFIFLLTTLAGGLGINLTSADTVIFYDISYNPQVERQAEDRCHRLGQTKPVTIYTLMTPGTVEEHVYEMTIRKTELNDLMLNEGRFALRLDGQEVTAIEAEKTALVQNLANAVFNDMSSLSCSNSSSNQTTGWADNLKFEDVELDITDVNK